MTERTGSIWIDELRPLRAKVYSFKFKDRSEKYVNLKEVSETRTKEKILNMINIIHLEEKTGKKVIIANRQNSIENYMKTY